MPTALEAYLDTIRGNQAQDLNTLQQAGAIQGLAANAQKAQRDAAYRQAIMSATTPEQQMNVAVQYGGPEAVLKAREQSLLSQDRIQAQKDMLQARLTQQKDAADARLEQQQMFATQMHEYRMALAKTAEERNAETARHNAQVEQFQQQNAATMAELRRQGLQIQQQAAEAKTAQQGQKNVQQLGTALERANLPEADATLRAVEDAVQKTPNLAKYLVGPLAKTPDIAVGALTPGMSKEEADAIRNGRQAAAKLFNITLKNRSGAAVTVPEFERLKQEFGSGMWNTPEQFINGLRQARSIIANHYRSVASGFGADALNAYNQNMRELGGTPLLEPQGTGKEDPLGIR